jgi:hypothetical protein
LVARHPALTMPGMTRLPVEIAPVKVDVAVVEAIKYDAFIASVKC